MQNYAAVFRTGETLTKGMDEVSKIFKDFSSIGLNDKSLIWNTELIETLELENLILQSLATIGSALNREESRGAHARDDYKERDDNNWLKHTLATTNENGSINITYRAVTLTTLTNDVDPIPPKKRVY